MRFLREMRQSLQDGCGCDENAQPYRVHPLRNVHPRLSDERRVLPLRLRRWKRERKRSDTARKQQQSLRRNEYERKEEERGTEVAAAEQKENTTGTPDENGNYLINGSFEEPDFSGWTVTNNNDVTEELDVYDRETDCFAGAQSLHFYSGNNPVDFSMKQTVSGLEDGTYKLTAHIQGDAAGDENPTVYFYALVDGEEVKADGKLQGYVNWYTVEIPGITPTDGAITVGAHVATAPGGWGTIDDITLVKE